jgi:hypothetical protein
VRGGLELSTVFDNKTEVPDKKPEVSRQIAILDNSLSGLEKMVDELRSRLDRVLCPEDVPRDDSLALEQDGSVRKVSILAYDIADCSNRVNRIHAELTALCNQLEV